MSVRVADCLPVLLAATCMVANGQPPDFEHDVAPLLVRRCVECHQGTEPAGGLLLTSHEGIAKGGDSGAVIDRESLDDSYFLQRIIDGEMPPKKQGQTQQLADSEVELLRRWIRGGAKWPAGRELDFFERTSDVRAGRDWWSLQPVVRPAVPKLKGSPQPASPIDAFVRLRLEAADIMPAPRADPATRLRRLYYDLLGLPPTQTEVDAFVATSSTAAWEQAIDRLLNSPQYGVRWARYWLDLARYADTSGYERDQEKPYAWKYRDWIVEALNADLPYDEFIVHQLAGDELEARTKQSIIATGFLRLGTWNDEPNDPADYQYDRLEDLVHTTSSAFLGMTVKCARCHSHKFDAITQDDYYRMAAAFWAGPIDRQGKDLGGPNAEELGFNDVLGWTDLGSQARPLHLLKNGERDKPLHEVIPASLSMLPMLQRTFDPPAPDATTTTRRLQLAKWIAHPENPLTPRVLVNRLWQHHFGKAIVRSPNNFGFVADPPTHPELLDWLAEDFMRGGWRIKRMHKLILMSETWQQASIHPGAEAYRRIDSGNRLWWRAERRRLDAETLRDSMLASSGELDLRIGGEGFRPTISAEALEGLSRKSSAWSPSPADEQLRRSLYIYAKRGLLPPMMTTFDLCDTTQSCGQRDSTTVPTQALVMLNNRFVHQRSGMLAKSVIESEARMADQVRLLWSKILRRTPTTDELELALDHVATQCQQVEREQQPASETASEAAALASLAHVLLNSNEFLYVD